MTKKIEIKFHVLHDGQDHIARNRSKLTVIRAGRRFGKTTFMEQCACQFAIDGKLVGWFTPKYKLMRASYRKIRSLLRPITSRANATEGIIELITGGSIRFWTLMDEDAGRGDKYNEVIIDEASLVKRGMRDIWEQAIAPTLIDMNGNALMAGTPKGVDADNFFWLACTNRGELMKQVWTEFHAPSSANPHLSVEALKEFERTLPPLVFQQEVLAEFVDWSGVSFFAASDLLVDMQPVPYPKTCENIIVVIDSASKIKKTHDGTAVIFCAYTPNNEIKLTILDWDYVQIEGGSLSVWLPMVFERANNLGVECGARLNALKYIEDKASGTILLQQCNKKRAMAETLEDAVNWTVLAIPSDLTAMGKEPRAIDASSFVYQGFIKFSEHAYNKVVEFQKVAKNHLWSQVIGFRFNGESSDLHDDLLDSFAYVCQLAK
jgi:hypothetical protein